MKPSYLLFPALFISAPLALVGCGNLDSEQGPPIATIRGELTSASTNSISAGSNVRVAVLWAKGGEALDGARRYEAALDLPVQPQFPSQFTVQLFSPPPESVMERPDDDAQASDVPPSDPGTPSVDPDLPSETPPAPKGMQPQAKTKTPADFRIATGSLVAYEDVNGNGKLDLVDDHASTFVDRIVGANPNMGILYIEGTLPEEAISLGVTKGYNLFSSHVDECNLKEATGAGTQTGTGESLGDGKGVTNDPPASTMPEDVGACAKPFQIFPMTTLFSLPISNDPKFADMMCKRSSGLGGDFVEESVPGSSGSEGSAGAPGGAIPPSYPDPSTYTCGPNGDLVGKTDCTSQSLGLCSGISMSCVAHGTYPVPTPVPADWPCPVPVK